MGTERITCGKCHRKCSGQVLSVGDTYFHPYCFTCQKCGYELGEEVFYNKDGFYYCAKCYLDNFGENCFKCGEFLEGEVITALGNTFHLDCFTCGQCKKFFPPGETVVFDGQDYVCEDCEYGVDPASHGQPLHKCAGCRKDIEHGQALMALDQHWHPNCFTCQKCGIVLHGEYMGKDGFAFCEKDYQAEFGVTCAGCQGYITGKVLQAGDKHYHPQCSRCAKCGQMFGEGEEMYLQGSEIWHPECSEMVREMERAENERAEMEQREAERREMEEETRRREAEKREAERQEAERRDAERRDAEQRDAERRDAERREAERREAEQRDVERRDAERREAERRDAERREAERRDAEMREAERLEAEHRDAEQRERDRKEREIEAERREAERREIEQREIERRDRERRETEYRESQRRDAERRDAERKREYYQQGKVGQQVDVNGGRKPPSPDFDDLPPPPRPEELPKGPPAPPTRTDSRAKDWKARYGSLPRTGSGPVNGDPHEVPIRNGPSRPRPYSYHEPSHNTYEETTPPTTVSSGGDQKFKTSVQLKIGKSTDDSSIGRTSTSRQTSSAAKSPTAEFKIYQYRELKVDNYRSPRGVDKMNLEKHLTDEEFREIFKMARNEFYELPKWKQIDHKKKVKLF